MPQMGESIAEGTIVRWIKKVGDKVDRDEPLFEISTDKVDAEIPSPAAGVVTEIRVKEGETVPVNSVVAVIGAGGPTRRRRSPAARSPTPAPTPQADGARDETAQSRPAPSAAPARRPPRTGTRTRRPGARRPERSARRHPPAVVAARAQDREGAQRRHLADSGHRHRRPRDEGRHPGVHRGRRTSGQRRGRGQRGTPPAPRSPPATPTAPAPAAGASDRVEKMSVMRKKIAEHMVVSRRTSAHVHSVFEVNFARSRRFARRRRRSTNAPARS